MLIAAGCFCLNANGQMVCLNAQSADTTAYTNGMSNDSIYFVCAGQNATVVATPTSGGTGYDFVWYSFSAALNQWVFANQDLDAASSTRNLPIGGFKVEIFDADGNLVESDICWVSRILFPPIVNANTIPPGCTSVQLSGLFFYPQITSYYNPPPYSTALPVYVNSETDITVCFEAAHGFVSDLSFHLIGPESCGSPHAVLSAAPFELQEDTMCNSGSDVSALCFSTTSSDNLDICENAPFSLTGVFGSYGSEALPIDWDVFIGCNANEEDWAVQVYDCVGGVSGELLDVTISFEAADGIGNPVNITYATPASFQLDIPDELCELDTNYQVTVPRQPQSATVIPVQFATEWVADPPFDIPNPINNLNLTLDPAPQVDTYFTLRLIGPDVSGACDGNVIDVEFYDYIAPEQSVISVEENVFCITDSAIQLFSTIADGTWSGPGIIDAETGWFLPAAAGSGVQEITFNPDSYCIEEDTQQMIIAPTIDIQIQEIDALCSNASAVQLAVNQTGGTWSGDGVVNGNTGFFNPALVSEGAASVYYEIAGVCPAIDSIMIEVVQFVPLSVTPENDHVCLSSGAVELEANVAGGTWSGPGVQNAAQDTFNPAAAGIGTWEITYAYDGVCSDEETINIQVDDPAVNIESISPVCVDADPVDIDALPPGGVWSGQGITNQITGVFNPNAIGAAGNYTVYYAIDNACNPVDSIVVVVEGYPQLQLLIPEGVCPESEPVLLTANIGGGIWSGGAVTGNSPSYFDPALATSDANTVSYAVDGVCDVQTSGIIQIYESPEILVSSDTSVCYDGTASLTATGAGSYEWSPAESLSEPLGSAVVASPDASTTYVVTGYSAQGCVGQAETMVTVLPEPEVSVNGPFTICEYDDVQLLASGLESYVWTGDGLNNYEIADPLADPAVSTVYTVSGLDANGCYGESSVAVEVLIPQASFEAPTYSGVSTFIPEITNTSNGEIFYWDFGNGENAITYDLNEVVEPEFSGVQTYVVTLTASIGDCISTYSAEFNSYYDSEIILIPNIVTMDGNNKNDSFRILTQNMESLDVEIFDRWGKKIGTYQGPDQKWSPGDYGAGNYYFIYSAVGLDGETYRGSGEFTVVARSE
jgi:hypothetical protein